MSDKKREGFRFPPITKAVRELSRKAIREMGYKHESTRNAIKVLAYFQLVTFQVKVAPVVLHYNEEETAIEVFGAAKNGNFYHGTSHGMVQIEDPNFALNLQSMITEAFGKISESNNFTITADKAFHRLVLERSHGNYTDYANQIFSVEENKIAEKQSWFKKLLNWLFKKLRIDRDFSIRHTLKRMSVREEIIDEFFEMEEFLRNQPKADVERITARILTDREDGK